VTVQNIAILIPARGGSKGIPKKNLQTVGGIPLISRAVLAAQASAVSKDVYVTTDDQEIASAAASSGAKIITRPAELSTDESSTEDAVLHFLETMHITSGVVLFVQPTSPFVRGDDIRRLADTCMNYDSCLTVTSSHGFLWKREHDGTLSGVNHSSTARLRRQDLSESEFLENGAAYGMRVEQFLQTRHRFFGRIGYVEMPRTRSIEIDGIEDLQLANCLSSLLDSK